MSNQRPDSEPGQQDARPGVDRRTFLRLGAAGGFFLTAAPILAACGDDAATTTTAAPPTTAGATTTEAPATTAGATSTTAAPTTTVAAVDSKIGGTIKLGMDSEIRNFDYHRIGALSDSWAPSQIFRGMSDLDPVTFRHVPEQALSWEANADFTVWTFTIRPGVLFHNGREMTAEDVVFSTTRVNDPETASFYIAQFENVGYEKIEATDSQTVVVTFAQPAPRAEELFFVHLNAIMPMEAIENINSEPVGSGPFKLKEFLPEVTTLERNPDYWEEDLPYLDEIQMITIEDETSRLAALRGGEVDWIRNPPLAEIAGLQTDASLNVQVVPSSWVDFFWMNMTNPKLADVRVRLAIAHAIDRDAANQRALFGLGTPAVTTVPPLTNVPLDVTPPAFDPDMSVALLADAGVAPGTLDLEISALDAAHIAVMAESLAADLVAVGINATPVATDFGLWLENLTNLDYDLASSAFISFIDPAPRSAELGAEADNTGYLDDEIRDWLEQGGAISDPGERGVFYSQAWNKYLNEGVVRVAITAAPYAVAMSNNIMGFEMYPEQQQRWESVWIDSNA